MQPEPAASRTGPLLVGTRGSLLARTQATWVVEQLRRHGQQAELVLIATQGDTLGETPIAALGRDGVFVRELERALVDGRIDAAVHSLKDMPTETVPELVLGAVPLRAMPFDVLVARGGGTLESLPRGAVVGTSSIRRIAQVRALREDVEIRPVRGNVDTRLRRLDSGDFDALVLAGAGLERLGLAGRITQVLRPDAFWPAVSQGALGIQVRVGDVRMHEALRPLDHAETHAAVRAERSFLAALSGGCLAPVGGFACRGADGRLEIGGCVLEDLGGQVARIVESVVAGSGEGTVAEGGGLSELPEALGRRLAAGLRSRGADAMLARMRERGAHA